jgi:ribosomal protein S18 acetylase RimI-like enzyme
MIEVRVLHRGDEPRLMRVASGVFDNAVDVENSANFLRDPRHHLAVAVEQDVVVGFCSAVDYIHPDKPPELLINEVGVAPAHRNRGVATKLLRALLEVGRNAACRHAWVLTDRSNSAAMRLYASAGGNEAQEDTVMFSFVLNEL